jgi:hypothetical protein
MVPIAFRFPSRRHPIAFPITSQYADLHGQNVPEMCEMRSDYPLVFRCVGLRELMDGFGFCVQTMLGAGLGEAAERGLQVLGDCAQRRS